MSPLFSSRRTPGAGLAKRRFFAAFTMAELLVATGIGSVVALITMTAMIQGAYMMKCSRSEMMARDRGSAALKAMGTAMQNARQVRIYGTYLGTGGAEAQFGSCIVVERPDGTSASYYRFAPNGDASSGGIYFNKDASFAPNPALDKLLVSSTQGLEFRRDISGSVRVGLQIGTFGYPSRTTGVKESERVRFSSSFLPRNAGS